MSLADRIIPPEALRFDRARPLTRPWPELDLWTRANPAIGGRVDPIAVWDEFERSITAIVDMELIGADAWVPGQLDASVGDAFGSKQDRT